MPEAVGVGPELHKPRLNSLGVLFNELKKPAGEGNSKTFWYDIGKKDLQRVDTYDPSKDRYGITDYKDGLDFVNQVHQEVRGFVSAKIPGIKEKIKSLEGFDDDALVDALVNNWVEERLPDIEGKRREILTLAGGHVVRWMETKAIENVLEGSSPEQLDRLGLTPFSKNILIDVLKASRKSDPLFIRFHALGQLNAKAPEDGPNLNILLDNEEYTYTSLFPHDNLGMANQFEEIVKKIETKGYESDFQDNSGFEESTEGIAFKSYMESLVKFYRNTDTENSQPLYDELISRYDALLKTDFPIVITPSTDTLFHEPYFDPEMRISLRTSEKDEEFLSYKKAQEGLVESVRDGQLPGLKQKNASADNIANARLHVVVSVGNYGANLLLNGVAQETPKPNILLFLNDQIRTYDDEFPEKMKVVTNTSDVFSGMSSEKSEELKKRMSRMATVLHEDVHYIYPDGTPEAKRMGKDPITAIDEVKAETLFKALVPSLVEKGYLEGTKDQWAAATLTSALQMLTEQSEDDAYGYATCFAVNEAFKSNAVVLSESGITITDTDKFFDCMKNASEKVIGLYQDEGMNPDKASEWIKDNCSPIPQVEDLKAYLQLHEW